MDFTENKTVSCGKTASTIEKDRHQAVFFYGGDGGNRTPVRKRFDKNFSGRRRLFTFPRPDGSRHPAGLGSFMMHGALKALRTHVHR